MTPETYDKVIEALQECIKELNNERAAAAREELDKRRAPKVGIFILPPIIGLCGYAGVGKDTVGRALTELYGYERRAFADALKEMCQPILRALCRDDVSLPPEQYKEIMRPIWVAVGKAGRQIDPDFWIKRLEAMSAAQHYVITDVRYKNEADWIRARGGKVVQIERGDKNGDIGPANDEERESLRHITCDSMHHMNTLPLEIPQIAKDVANAIIQFNQ